MILYRSFPIAITVVVLMAGCSGGIATSEGQRCSEELSAAEAELDKAKADGLGDAVSISKAAGLITAAAVQKQFEKFECCIDKAQRARAFIADAKKK
jgi:hypothetical protein